MRRKEIRYEVERLCQFKGVLIDEREVIIAREDF